MQEGATTYEFYVHACRTLVSTAEEMECVINRAQILQHRMHELHEFLDDLAKAILENQDVNEAAFIMQEFESANQYLPTPTALILDEIF